MSNTSNIQLEHQDVQRLQQKFPVCILANDMDVPMNVGSVFRIADALGIEKIHLTGSSVVPPNRKIRKTSRSAENAVDFEYNEHALDVVRLLKAEGYSIVSLEITDSSVDIREYDKVELDKICLVLGSESLGVSKELLEISDHTFHIPMFGQNSSMNVATACAIALFEITKKHMP